MSPSKPPEHDDQLKAGINLLLSWGFVPTLEQEEGHPLYAGTDTARRRVLQDQLDDPSVDAILCTRGGVGAQQIVDDLDLAAFVERRGVFVGYSDATVLHHSLNSAGLVTFHGPAMEWSPRNGHLEADGSGNGSATCLRQALASSAPITVATRSEQEGAELTRGSPVTAPIVGGNLSLLASSIGTPTQPDATGSVLFIEETEEGESTFDRHLTQLARAGCFTGIAGIALGQFFDCVRPTERLAEHLGKLDVPIVGGLPVGHGLNQETMPLGAMTVLDPPAGEVRFERPSQP